MDAPPSRPLGDVFGSLGRGTLRPIAAGCRRSACAGCEFAHTVLAYAARFALLFAQARREVVIHVVDADCWNLMITASFPIARCSVCAQEVLLYRTAHAGEPRWACLDCDTLIDGAPDAPEGDVTYTGSDTIEDLGYALHPTPASCSCGGGCEGCTLAREPA